MSTDFCVNLKKTDIFFENLNRMISLLRYQQVLIDHLWKTCYIEAV